MINNKKQEQSSGDNSINQQAGRDIINTGISYSDAKKISLDVFESMMPQLISIAQETAFQRAESFMDNLLERIRNVENGNQTLNEFSKPGMLILLGEAQKQCARSGDKDLEAVLIDLIMERAFITERSTLQIVLEEAVDVIGKLTSEQMDALTINFLITRTMQKSLSSIELLKEYVHRKLIPFLGKLTDNETCYEHLEYSRCVSIERIVSSPTIEKIYSLRYRGLFQKGFSKEEFAAKFKDFDAWERYKKFIAHCLHDQDKYQINAINEECLTQILEKEDVLHGHRAIFVELSTKYTMDEQSIKSFLITLDPSLDKLFVAWQSGCSLLSKMNLTTVGLVIAQANFSRRTGERLDPSIWIQ